jgi:hypothetical protein
VGSNPTPAAQPGGFLVNHAGLRADRDTVIASVIVRRKSAVSRAYWRTTGARDTAGIVIFSSPFERATMTPMPYAVAITPQCQECDAV